MQNGARFCVLHEEDLRPCEEWVMAFSLTWLPRVLLGAGLKVAEQPGWRDSRPRRCRADQRCNLPSHGWRESREYAEPGVVTNGRPDLPGPLAQLCLGRDGTYFVVAAGRCNHAGAGNWQGITTGNTNFIGIEAENTGFVSGPKADPWPAVQMDAYRRGVAAILKKIRANAIMCCGHKEYAYHGPQDRPNLRHE